MFHFFQNFLIFVTQETGNAPELLHDIFKMALNLGLLKINVLIHNGDAPMWSLYFYKPYLQSCHSIDVIKIETFSPENYTNELDMPFNSLFASSQLEFPKCPLFVSVFPFEPFVIIHNVNGSIIFTGLDITIVNEIAETLHLVPIYLLAKKRGIIYQNGTATGAVGMVINEVANMTIGNFALSLDRVRTMSYTKSYCQNALKFVFKNSGETTPLAKLMSPFQTIVWISVAFLLSISILIILLTKNLSLRQRHFIIGGQMNRTPILNMMNALIGNAISNPKMTHLQTFGVFARTLLLLWLLFWLVVRNSYQGSLYDSLQSQRAKSPFDTVENVRMSSANIYVSNVGSGFIPENFNRKR